LQGEEPAFAVPPAMPGTVVEAPQALSRRRQWRAHQPCARRKTI